MATYSQVLPARSVTRVARIEAVLSRIRILTTRSRRRSVTIVLAGALTGALAGAASCDTPTVSCWPDEYAPHGTACKCTRGATPPSCVDLGSCLKECPL